MRRIMIVGQPGSGKTTLARTLGAALDVPVHHVDRLFWVGPGQRRGAAEVMAALSAVLAQDRYILEGGHSETYADRLAGCDTLIWLDLGLIPCLYRVWRRAKADLRKNLTGIDPSGRMACDPPMRRMLARHGEWQEELMDLAKRLPPAVRLVHLRSSHDVGRFVDALRPGPAR